MGCVVVDFVDVGIELIVVGGYVGLCFFGVDLLVGVLSVDEYLFD